MKGGEGKFWNEIRIPLNSMGDADRLESHATCIGRPDVNICLSGGIVWDIELKYSDNGKINLRPAQRMWFVKRGRVGAKACVFTKAVIQGEAVYFLNMINKIPDGDSLDDWINAAHVVWDHKVDYAEFEEILRA